MTALVAAPEFSFNADTHEYTLKTGHRIPGVTSLLSIGGLDSGYDYIQPGVMEHARLRGTACHRAWELIDRDELDEATVHDEIKPYVTAYRKFLAETGFKPELIEKRLVHPTYGYAGTLDRTGMLFGRYSLIDYKAVAAITPATAVQLSAYLELLRANYDRTPGERRALQLRPDGTYRLTAPYTGIDDLRVFLAIKTVDNWKRKNT